MHSLAALVDPFYGNGQTDLPEKEGIAATWFFPKAQTGNTHPGACLPFGMVSACAYSGAYVTGYGLHRTNTHGAPARMFDELTATGFTHFHPSGTGAIKYYYNYFRVVPMARGGLDTERRYRLRDEAAEPGYYATTLEECGVRAELTVAARGAVHRYRFPAGSRSRLAIDFANGGLAEHERSTRPTEASVRVADDGFSGHVVMEGIPIYVAGRLRSGGVTGSVFVGGETFSRREIGFEKGEVPARPFGVVLDSAAGSVCELAIAFSMKSAARAEAHLVEMERASFDETRRRAASQWESRLRAIEIDAGAGDASLFYSNLYHSLVKPTDCRGESPFYDDADFFTDFATLWDQYKTTLPLILTLYPEVGSGIVNSLVATAAHVGEFTNAAVLSRDFLAFEGQARALAHHVLADARTRHLDGIDWSRTLDLMMADLLKERNRDFHETGIAHPFTHTLDLACGAFATALVAADMRRDDVRDRAWAWTRNWRNVYDPDTGILGPSKYYEGGPWNYSFRLLPDMVRRIALHGGAGPFVRDLERFFGYGAESVDQVVDPADAEAMERGIGLGRFEGFNNEPDMETPYGFIYAGRPDRTAEVVRAGMKHQFRPGRGGLPGNNDSGGLTATYVWNALGLFPVAGQPRVLIGSPVFPEARLHLPESDLTVVARGAGERAIYVREATFNGRSLGRAYLTMRELLAGGELILTMGEEPEGWATKERPPTYSEVESLTCGEY